MHYYAIINEEYIVMEVVSSAVVIDDPTYIEITEEQYNDEGFIGYFYDQDKNEFVGYIMWMCTSNEVRYDETYRTLTGKLNEMDEEIATHTHTEYVSADNLQVLEDIVDTKADNSHQHDEYSLIGHSHDGYVSQADFDALETEVEGKANVNHSHSNYSETTHNHDSEYSSVEHDHDEDYSAIDHSHNNYATVTSLNELSSTVSGKANASHSHDDRYYTETEIDTKLSAKSDSSHTHAGVYDVNGAAASALSAANTYTDSKIDALVGEGASTTLDTIGEISFAIEDNQDAIDLLNTAIGNKANISDLTSHTGNKSNPHGVTLSQLGVTATAAELNYVDGVTSNIQTQINSKAASGHTHDAATTSAAGFMTAAMVTKLNGIATGANAYAHPTYTTRTGVPTANQTPAFGGTFTVSQPVSDATGHITAVNSRTITIPSAVATSSTNGLMSKSDKSKLDGIVLATVSEVETYLGI